MADVVDNAKAIAAKTVQVKDNVALAASGDPKAMVALFSDGIEAASVVGEMLKGNETSNKTATLTFCLAPSFGPLTKDSFAEMDMMLKASLGFAIVDLRKKVEEKGTDLSWEEVTATMNQCESLVALGPPVAKADSKKYESTDWLNLDGSPDPKKTHDIQAFLTNTIGDEDILVSVGIKDTAADMSEDITRAEKISAVELIKRIVAATGSAVTNFGEVFYGRTAKKETLLDIGILRYPNLDDPYVNVYRVKLEAVRECQRIAIREVNTSSLYCEINSQKYEPSKKVLAAVQPEVLKKAAGSLDKYVFE